MLLQTLCLVLLYYCAWQRSLLTQLQQPIIQSLAGASVCVLTLLWHIDAQLPGWPAIHFLGLTTLVLLLGLRLALFTLATPILLSTLLTMYSTANYELDYLPLLRWCLLALTAIASYGFFLCCDRLLPTHFFTFIFASGFINAMFSACFHYGLSFVLWQNDSEIIEIDWFLLPLIALPEALLNGMALTMLVVYRPQWVAALRMRIFEQ